MREYLPIPTEEKRINRDIVEYKGDSLLEKYLCVVELIDT